MEFDSHFKIPDKIWDIEIKFNETFEEIHKKVESIKDPRLINLNKLFDIEEQEIEEFAKNKDGVVALNPSDWEVDSLGGPSRKSYQGDAKAFLNITSRSYSDDLSSLLLAQKKLLRLGKLFNLSDVRFNLK